MTRKFLSPVGLPSGDTLPATGTVGALFYNTTDSSVYAHDGTSWVSAGEATNGLPSGGLEGQILAKVDDTNYNTEWVDNYAPDTRIVVKNDSGVSLSAGTAVMAVGATGDQIRVAKAVADGTVEPRYMLGVMFETVANGASGYLTMTGTVSNLDTSAYTLGDVLYIDPTTPGALTTTAPSSPNLQMPVAIVTRVNASSGRVFVRMWTQQAGLHELHDVLIDGTPADNEVLAYNAATGVWINQTPSEAGLAALTGATFTGNVTAANLYTTGTTVTGYNRGADGNAVIGLVSVNGQTSNQAFLQRDSGFNGVFRILNNGSGTTLIQNAQNVATAVPLTVKTAPSQLANATEWQNSAGTVIGGLNGNGQFYTGSTAPLGVGTGGATTAASGNGTTATITTTSAHALAVGDRITVSGVTPTGYNGTFIATAVTANTVSYTNSTTGSQTVAGVVLVDSQVSITPRSAGTGALTIRSVANQSALLTRWINTAGSTAAWVSGGGDASFQATYANWFLSVTNALNTNVATNIRGAANQNADLFRVQNSSSTTLAGLNATGQFFTGSTTTQKVRIGVTVTAAAASSATVATYTYTGSSTQLFAVGQVVTIAGFSTQTFYNGTFTITAVGGSSSPWTFTVVGSGFTVGSASSVSGVTVSIPAQASIVPVSPGTTGLVIKAVTGQTATLQSWQNSTGNTTAYVTAEGDVVGRTLNAFVPDGTAPLAVASTTMVTNLNAELLGGYSASVTNVADTVVVRGATGDVAVSNVVASGSASASTFASTVATGTAPFIVSSTTKVANLNADLLDGYSASTFSDPNTVAVRTSSGDVNAANLVAASIVAGPSLVAGSPSTADGTAYANAFIKTGGTSSQFLKANGSIDTTTYSTQSFAAAAYNQANAAYGFASAAYDVGVNAFNQANAAYYYADQAYNIAVNGYYLAAAAVPTTAEDATAIITAATGFGSPTVTYKERNGVVQISLNVVRTGANIAAGNITNTTVCTIADGYRPILESAAGGGGSSPALGVVITTAGTVILTALGSALNNGANLDINATYIKQE